MMLKNLIVILIALVFNGCCEKEPTRIEYKEKTVTIKVPVRCKVPKVKCDLKQGSNLVERFSELLGCIELHKEASKVCQ